MSDNLQPCMITELVCTRLSHDLIGNIGAVANAVEILDEDPEGVADIKPILQISSHTLSARLKFFRLAFGLNNAAPKNTAEIEQICKDYLSTVGSRQTPITLVLSLKTPALYKIVMLCIMSMADIFIRGGTLKIDETENGLTVAAQSPAPLSAGKIQILQNTINGQFPEENPSQTAALIYMMQLLQNSAVKITLQATELQAVLRIA